MKAREVIEFASSLLGDQKVAEILVAGGDYSETQQKLIKPYINCLNIAVDTIASRYYETLKKVTVISDCEARVPYEAIDERVESVKKVLNKRGEEVEFYSLPFSLFLPRPNTEYVVVSKILPAKVTTLDENVNLLPFITIKIVAFLMASDLYLSRGEYDESKFFFSKFESEIYHALSTSRGRTLRYAKLI